MSIEIDTLYENMYPNTNVIEDKIKLLLVLQGYKRSDIHFRNNSYDKRKSLRLGYWLPIEKEDLSYVIEKLKQHCEINIEEWSIFDEECGWKYSYDLKYEEVS